MNSDCSGRDFDAFDAAVDQGRQMRDAAERLRDLYEPSGELTEWTALDNAEFVDYRETLDQ